MGDYDSILTCTVGSASFTLLDYEVTVKPVVKNGFPAGKEISIVGEGYVKGSSASDFAAKVQAVMAALALPAQNFRVTAMGQIEYDLPAAACVNSGPVITAHQLKQGDGGMFVKHFEFTVQATQSYAAGGGVEADPISRRRVQTATRENDLAVVTWTGDLVGTAVDAAYARLLEQAAQTYPWPNWVLSGSRDASATANEATYTITATQLAEPLPSVGDSWAVSGQSRYRRERAAGQRMLDTLSYDLLVMGDPIQLYTLLRPKDVFIQSESFEVTGISEVRLACSFTTLVSGSMDDLLEWEWGMTASGEEAIGRLERYEGIGVDLVYDVCVEYRLTITGRAVGLGLYPAPPASPDLVKSGYLPDKPREVATRKPSEWEYETAWTFSFVGVRALGIEEIRTIRASMERPRPPTFR